MVVVDVVDVVTYTFSKREILYNILIINGGYYIYLYIISNVVLHLLHFHFFNRSNGSKQYLIAGRFIFLYHNIIAVGLYLKYRERNILYPIFWFYQSESLV
jgi:hypothetical protein